MKKIVYLSIVFGCTASYAVDLDFANLQRFVFGLPENVASDNADWEDPQYVEFYHNYLKPSWFAALFRRLGFTKENPWETKNVDRALKNILVDRKKFIEKGAYATHIMAKPETKFVVWGDLFGAVHSLFRDLDYFYRHGIIDEQLRIIKPDYNFVFLGNAVDRSPYSLEVLHIIVVLMEQNPDHVFYCKGKHETDNYWKNFGLKRAILQYFGKGILYNAREAAVEQLVTDFFDSLPGALYISQKDSTHNVICLSNQIENYELGVSYFERFFSRDVGSVEYISTANKTTGKDYAVVAILKGGDEIKTAFSSQGLTMLAPYQDATVWSLLSCPTPIYQKFFNFYYDSFAMLTMGQTIVQSTIQQLYQDVRNRQGFNRGDLLNILTGEMVYDAKPEDIYYVGSTMALTKNLQYNGQGVKFSMFNLINSSNERNFLDGHFVRVIILDDAYVPSLALKNVDKLMNDYKIDTILLPMGSPTLEAYFNLVKDGKVNVLFPATGSPDFRREDFKHIIHWRASYQDEVRALLEYMITENAIKKFAFFYQNDSYGLGALEAAHAFLKEKGITEWVDIPYNKSGINFDDAVAAIRKAQPDAIGLFSIPEATEGLFRKLGVELLFNKKLFGLSFIAEDSFRTYVKDQGIKVLLAEVVPNPRTSNLEIVKEFRAFMDKYGHPYNIFSLEGYICTQLYLEALKAIKPPVTAEKIIQYFESFKNFSYKGLQMTFDPKYRDLTQSVWIELDDKNWKEYKPKR